MNKIDSYCIDCTLSSNNNRGNEKTRQSIKSVFLLSLLMITLGYFFIRVVISGIDKHFDNRDIMLCESAKISGNKEYLEKCECYYQGKEIICLYK